MSINWRKSESYEKPLEVDYETSPTAVFIRRKIKESDKGGLKFYEYEEAKLTPTEYTVYAAELNRQNTLALMEGLAAIYAKIGG